MLTPRSDGWLASDAALASALMGPRLQGEYHPEGRLDLSLWSAGRLGRLRTTPMAGPYVYGPNAVLGQAGSVHVARSAPVLMLRGVRALQLYLARRCAGWAEPVSVAAVRTGANWSLDLPWGAVRVEQRGPDLLVAAGENAAELERGLALSVGDVVTEAEAYAGACDRLPEAEPLLRSLVLHGAHAAWASARRLADGGFGGLSAGPAYSAPARTYFRDGYWTLPMLLRLEPDAARAQVEMLAGGIRADGEAPSGVLAAGPMQAAWEAVRAGGLADVHVRPGEWWSDHFDSPLLFVLALDMVAAGTGDAGLVERHWPRVLAVFERYVRLSDGDGLPCKPRHDRDWADNVFREGAVAYDLGLWAGVLEAVERRGRERGDPAAERAEAALRRLRAGLDARLWTAGGWYAEYVTPEGFAERHLALDSLMLLRFGAVPDARAEAVLEAVEAQLGRHGWGTPCVWPPYTRRADLRAKSAFAGRYHNGGDWPWLDGLYAAELLRRGLGGWRRPLTRWWEACLANGWTSPVEWYAPGYGRGSLLQAWSSLPAAVALAHREAVLAGEPAT